MKRRWLLWILIAAFVVVIATRFSEVRELFKTLSGGQWQWILVAALLQMVYYTLHAALYRSAFDIVGIERRLTELLPVLLASLFVNVAAPSGGASGFALFVDDANRRGQSGTRTAAGKMLAHVADFSALLIVVTVGMTYLFLRQDLQVYQIIGAIVLILLIAVQAGAVLLGFWQAERLRRWLNWLQRTINGVANRLRRPAALADGWAEEIATELIDAAVAIAAHPWKLLRTLGIGLAAFVVDILSLYTLFLAFRYPVGTGTLVAGFAIGFLFWIVAITPQGIGVVEGVMALVFNSLEVPAATATVIALAFRGLTFWIPFGLGFVLLRTVKSFHEEKRTETGNETGEPPLCPPL